VVLDLMIHDLDVVLAFVKSPVTSVDGVGIPVLSKSEDIANVRLRFANGCVANLTASRISPERMRKIRAFSGPTNPCYISLDYRVQEGFIYRVARDGEEESSLLKKVLATKLGLGKDSAIVSEFAGKKIVREPVPIAKEEPLKMELQSFIDCVRERQTPLVSGESAKRALDLAARYGGDELAAVLYDVPSEHAVQLAEAVRVAVMNLGIGHLDGAPLEVVTISIGVGLVRPTLARSPDGAVQLADEALYAAKRNGRNRVELFESEYDALSTGTFRTR